MKPIDVTSSTLSKIVIFLFVLAGSTSVLLGNLNKTDVFGGIGIELFGTALSVYTIGWLIPQYFREKDEKYDALFDEIKIVREQLATLLEDRKD